MCYLELTLGRVCPFLAWYEIGRSTLNYIKSTGLDFSKFERDFQEMDALLGCLILNMNKQDVVPFKELKSTKISPTKEEITSLAIQFGWDNKQADKLAKKFGV